MSTKAARFFTALPAFLCIALVFSCADSTKKPAEMLGREQRFTLGYGSFEDELNLFNMAQPGEIATSLFMQDGFFYIANGKAQKVMQFTSFGDLLGIYYNPESNPPPSFAQSAPAANAGEGGALASRGTQLAVPYKFDTPSKIAVDTEKNIYVVDRLPLDRQKQDEDANLLLRDVVLRFSADGAYKDYLGQRGSGGVPFPYISNIYATAQNELVVVSLTGDGSQVNWFNAEGFLLYSVIFDAKSLPNPFEGDGESSYFVSLDGIAPAHGEHVLYLKLDYYISEIDATSGVEEGISYKGTYLYPLDVENGVYLPPVSVPSYEQTELVNGEKLVFVKPFDFLGASESGWFFFMVPVEDGYILQIMQSGGQKLIRKQLSVANSEIMFDSFSLSKEGIVSALLAGESEASVVWWRTDAIIDALIK